MTAVTTQTNQHTCVAREIAQPDGSDARDNPTTVASPNGFSVTAKTTVATTATSCQKTALFVNRKPTSSARTIAASPSSGLVTLLTTAAMEATKRKRSARENIASALSRSSIVTTENASQAGGDAVSLNVNRINDQEITKIAFRSRRRLRRRFR